MEEFLEAKLEPAWYREPWCKLCLGPWWLGQTSKVVKSIKTVNIGWGCGSGQCMLSTGLESDSPAQQKIAKTSNVFLAKLENWLGFFFSYAKIHRELQGALNSQDDPDGVQWLFFSLLQQNT